MRRLVNDLSKRGDHLFQITVPLTGPEIWLDKALGQSAGVHLAVGVGEDVVHLGRAIRHSEVPHPVEKPFAGFDVSGFGGDNVAYCGAISYGTRMAMAIFGRGNMTDSPNTICLLHEREFQAVGEALNHLGRQ